MTLDPNVVDMQDGKFELMLIRPPKDAVELMGCIQALTGQRYDTPMLTFCSASRLTVTASPEMAWTLDGEKEEGHETVEVENLHRAIRLIQGGSGNEEYHPVLHHKGRSGLDLAPGQEGKRPEP